MDNTKCILNHKKEMFREDGQLRKRDDGRIIIKSFPSALQLRVSFGLLNNLPPFLSM
jgi:hypothetical protein